MLGLSWLGTTVYPSRDLLSVHLQRALKSRGIWEDLGLALSQEMAPLWGCNLLISVDQLAHLSLP